MTSAISRGALAAESLGELGDRAAELEDAVHGALVLGADRREHAVGADERVDGQQPEVRRRVDHDLVVVVDDRLERVVQEPLAAELADEAHLDAGELAGGRDHVDAVDASDDRVGGSRPTGEHVDQVDAERRAPRARAAGSARTADRCRRRGRGGRARASSTPMFAAVVVFPTPPFWFATTVIITRPPVG